MLLHLKAKRESDVTHFEVLQVNSVPPIPRPDLFMRVESGHYKWGFTLFEAVKFLLRPPDLVFSHTSSTTKPQETWRDIPRVDYVQSLLHWLIENDNIFCPFSIYVAGFALLSALSDFVQRHLTALTAWQCFCTINTWANHRSKTLPAPTNSIRPSCKLCEKITMWKHSVLYELFINCIYIYI